MKQVLSLLLAYVFMHAQTWALSGGPNYNNGAVFPDSLIGTYTAVMIPSGASATATDTTPTDTTASPASIGVFAISVFEAGIAIGSAIIFANGTSFVGQVGGLADADKSTINGMIAGSSTFDVSETEISSTITTTDPNTGIQTTTNTFTTKNFPIEAQGKFETNVVLGDPGAFTKAPAGSGQNGTGGGSTTTSTTNPTSLEVGDTNAARLEGKAVIGTFFNIDPNTGTPIITQTITYSIDGLKQTNVPSNVTNLGISFSSGGGGSGT